MLFCKCVKGLGLGHIGVNQVSDGVCFTKLVVSLNLCKARVWESLALFGFWKVRFEKFLLRKPFCCFQRFPCLPCHKGIKNFSNNQLPYELCHFWWRLCCRRASGWLASAFSHCRAHHLAQCSCPLYVHIYIYIFLWRWIPIDGPCHLGAARSAPS